MVGNLAEKIPSHELDELLAREYVSHEGLPFIPADDTWALSFNDKRKANVCKAEFLFSVEDRSYFRLALSSFAQINTGDSVRNIVSYLNMFRNDYPDLNNILDPIQFISLKNKRGPAREYQVSTLRGFFRFWHSSGLWGVSDEFIEHTNALSFKGNEKGRAVLTHDPHSGPYSPIEMQGIYTGMANAYGVFKLDVTDYLVGYLFAELGQRARQYAQLRFGDFTSDLVVNMPRAKQRGGGFRKEFSKFVISESLYELVQLQKKRVNTLIGKTEFIDHCPLLPNYRLFGGSLHSGDEITEEHHAPKFAWSEALARVEIIINVISERTGERLRLRATRFRRTLGTDLAREGYGEAVIATALDHQDKQNVRSYIEVSAEMATRLDQKLSRYLAPIAQAFAGVIVKDEQSAIRGNDLTSRIRTHDGEESIGTCGQMGFCGANAPVACYTCVKFQAWRDAPHEEVLIQLLDEREEIIKTTGDHTIAGILDRSILAVEDVIQRCERMRKDEEESDG